MSEPSELRIAKIIDGFCQRWGCLPSAIKGESAAELFHMMRLLEDEEGESYEPDEEELY